MERLRASARNATVPGARAQLERGAAMDPEAAPRRRPPATQEDARGPEHRRAGTGPAFVTDSAPICHTPERSKRSAVGSPRTPESAIAPARHEASLGQPSEPTVGRTLGAGGANDGAHREAQHHAGLLRTRRSAGEAVVFVHGRPSSWRDCGGSRGRRLGQRTAMLLRMQVLPVRYHESCPVNHFHPSGRTTVGDAG